VTAFGFQAAQKAAEAARAAQERKEIREYRKTLEFKVRPWGLGFTVQVGARKPRRKPRRTRRKPHAGCLDASAAATGGNVAPLD
jgi:hypothetical protein